ncbi:MAG: HD-GYP domain-containing protein [Spirochaetaceae bacterium]|jgi:HD-GYP domain-containing protein (c-di-GMP phosphodiesterase class II)|nr:HD-GYP domain-containing protein [Spirochaetaceae bacterium]
MKTFNIKDIPAGSFFSQPVYLDERFILTTPEVMFSPELLKTLQEWEFKEIQSDGEPQEEYSGADDAVQETEGIAENALLSDGEQIRGAEKTYREFLKYVETLFNQVATQKEFHFNQVAERVKELCDAVKENRRYLLRVMKGDLAEGQNYMASHAVKSAIIAIIIGGFIKLPTHRLIELGVAALLHEIGMIKLPPQTYLSKRALSPQERKLILSHPILSFNLLKNLDFPLVVSLAALEHHERENGAGYPQKLTGEKISLYAKIIAVACSYEALTSSRPHKDAKDGYSGMLDLLKNEGKQYDDTVVKALVFSLSIYPIGLYVLLSNGKKGQVVDVNPENPKYPMVQIFGELTPDGKNKVIETSQEGVYIIRPLKKEEIS